MEYEATAEIDAPRERVFAWLRDSERLKQWIPNLVEDEVVADVRGGGVGTRFRQVYIENDRRMEMTGEVVAFEPNRRLACDISGAMFDLHVDYRLERIARGTKITQNARLKFRNPVFRIIAAIAGKAMRRKSAEQAQAQFAKLAALIAAEGN